MDSGRSGGQRRSGRSICAIRCGGDDACRTSAYACFRRRSGRGETVGNPTVEGIGPQRGPRREREASVASPLRVFCWGHVDAPGQRVDGCGGGGGSDCSGAAPGRAASMNGAAVVPCARGVRCRDGSGQHCDECGARRGGQRPQRQCGCGGCGATAVARLCGECTVAGAAAPFRWCGRAPVAVHRLSRAHRLQRRVPCRGVRQAGRGAAAHSPPDRATPSHWWNSTQGRERAVPCESAALSGRAASCMLGCCWRDAWRCGRGRGWLSWLRLLLAVRSAAMEFSNLPDQTVR